MDSQEPNRLNTHPLYNENLPHKLGRSGRGGRNGKVDKSDKDAKAKNYRVWSRATKDAFIFAYHTHFSANKAIKAVGGKNGEFQYNCKVDPIFRDQVFKITKEDRAKIETEAIRAALGLCTTTDKLWVRQFDKDGNPLSTPSGEPVMYLREVRERRIPAQADLLELLLTAYGLISTGDTEQKVAPTDPLLIANRLKGKLANLTALSN